ncbi:MAG: mycothiol system anti-sigma-R factor [Micrococcales bacterium]|nr:mycothiol system anti-sigma-R factor [Micrococcales bacterium]
MNTQDVATAEGAGSVAYNCEDALPRLYQFIDNELTLEEVQAMHDHLNGCESCTFELTVRVKLKQIIAESCFDPAPEGLRQRVAERLAALKAGTVPASGN